MKPALRGWPRTWPKSALAGRKRGPAPDCGFGVDLFPHQSLALSLLYWLNWRDRLDRGLIKVGFIVSPGPTATYFFLTRKGRYSKKQALHNALARLRVSREGPHSSDPARGTVRLFRRSPLARLPSQTKFPDLQARWPAVRGLSDACENRFSRLFAAEV